LLRRRAARSVIDHVIDCRREILHARARDDDRIAASVGFLGNPKKFPAVVLPEFDVKMLPLDLQLPGLYEVIHFLGKKRRSLGRLTSKREADFWTLRDVVNILWIDSWPSINGGVLAF
jgi:hypothetical protein